MKEPNEKEAGLDVLDSTAGFEAALAAAGKNGLTIYYGAAGMSAESPVLEFEHYFAFLKLAQGMQKQGYAVAVAGDVMKVDAQYVGGPASAHFFLPGVPDGNKTLSSDIASLATNSVSQGTTALINIIEASRCIPLTDAGKLRIDILFWR